ncbi:MAG: hypothetical protein ABW168_29350 [Sedimenticola sp.]
MDDNSFAEAVLAVKARLYGTTDLAVLRKVATRVAPLCDAATLDRPRLVGVVDDCFEELSDAEDRDSRLDQLERWLTAGREGYVAQHVPAIWRKDLKITGQIGDLKSGLSFVSYLRQVDTAVAKGHSDTEIVEAVLRAIQPGNRLKSYLEGRDDLDLATLNTLIRSYYREKSPTELYQQLCNLSQTSEETAQDFLIRALDLRQQVLFASKQKDAGMKYDPELVKSMTIRSLSTGLREDSVRYEFQTTLAKRGVSDEELLQTLNLICALDNERKTKIERPRQPNVHQIEYEQKSKGNKSEMEELRAEIASLRRHFDNTTVKDGKQPTGDRVRRRQGCKKCVDTGNTEKCDHCFQCGASDHWQRGCRAKKLTGSASGNGKGSPGVEAQ